MGSALQPDEDPLAVLDRVRRQRAPAEESPGDVLARVRSRTSRAVLAPIDTATPMAEARANAPEPNRVTPIQDAEKRRTGTFRFFRDNPLVGVPGRVAIWAGRDSPVDWYSATSTPRAASRLSGTRTRKRPTRSEPAGSLHSPPRSSPGARRRSGLSWAPCSTSR